MSPQERADEIVNIVNLLNRALDAAFNERLSVRIDTHAHDYTVIGDPIPRTRNQIHVKVSRVIAQA